MRVFSGKGFSRWARKERIDEATLCTAANEAFNGQADGDLGHYLFKKRIARKAQGKSGGYRTILGFRKTNSDRIFFLHGFSKKARATITAEEQKALAVLAADLIGTTETQIDALKARGAITELECEG